MKKLMMAALILAAASLFAACLPLMMLSVSDAANTEAGGDDGFFGQGMENYDSRYEALSWLKGNKNPSALAGGRFADTKEAIEFVESLYAAGAAKVWVTGISAGQWMERREGGPYADTLVVEMPKDEGRRKKVMGIYRREVEIYGCNMGEEEEGYDGDKLYLWWG